MSVRPPLRVGVTRHDEKEQKLKEFVRHHLDTLGTEHATIRGPLMVVARSIDSPVVKALLALRHDIHAANLKLRLILAQLDNDALPESWETDVAPITCEVKWARRPRLIEAHEQLVLGPDTCWIGDCMRRDPAKCDAFENFIEDCGEASGCAIVSFERLWAISEVISAIPHPTAAMIAETVHKMEGQPHEVGTRH